jgi:hypothetical protein
MLKKQFEIFYINAGIILQILVEPLPSKSLFTTFSQYIADSLLLKACLFTLETNAGVRFNLCGKTIRSVGQDHHISCPGTPL